MVVSVVALSGRQPPGAVNSPPPSSAIQPTAAASAEPTPPGNHAARSLLEVVDRLLVQRADLVGALAKDGTDVAAIADLLRDVNTSIVLQDGPLAELAADPVTADLATRIRAINEATFDAVRRTQRASITNEAAYRAGAEEVVGTLAGLAGIRDELSALADGSAAPKAAPTQPATGEPSGVTP
jgi:hypothetical protein